MKMPESTSLDVSSCPDSMKKEVEDLRQQLQSMKKQTMAALEQVRKSSDREHDALRQARESLELEKTAASNAARSAQRETYMLDLMTDASQYMAGTLLLSFCSLPVLLYESVYYIDFFFFISRRCVPRYCC
jgi:tRNA U34 5-carboxymethylaminomethyl modifying GTPase MnmE/TrmE